MQAGGHRFDPGQLHQKNRNTLPEVERPGRGAEFWAAMLKATIPAQAGKPEQSGEDDV